MKTEQTDRNDRWIIVRIDGKIASISTDYRHLAAITARLACTTQADIKAYKELASRTERVSAETVGFDDVWKLRQTVGWEDLILLGTDFQKKVWKRLWELTHSDETSATGEKTGQTDKTHHLLSYSNFAEMCNNKAGVRAVAHAISLNPISVIIPCHLVVPKEAIDRINDIQRKAEATIFKGEDLCISKVLSDTAIDFGEYALGKDLKRKLISLENVGVS